MYSDFYEIPLSALRFEKVEENHKKVNDTEENDARPHQKYKPTSKRTTYDAHRQQRNAESTTSERHARNTHASRTTKRKQRKNVNKRFQRNDKPEHDVTDNASQIKVKDLKKNKRIF